MKSKLSRFKNKLQERNDVTGFTIIEVVLVLAIAGLIFLVVFLAVPQLQRSQRDSQRTSDLGRFMTSLETYASNNNGRYPEDDVETETFMENYLVSGGSEFADPSTGPDPANDGTSSEGIGYDVQHGIGNLTIGANDNIAEDGATIYYHSSAQCAENEGEMVDAAARQVAAMVELENGVAFCQDNN